MVVYIILKHPEIIEKSRFSEECSMFILWLKRAMTKYGSELPYIKISRVEDLTEPVSSSSLPLLSHLAKLLAQDEQPTMRDYKPTPLPIPQADIVRDTFGQLLLKERNTLARENEGACLAFEYSASATASIEDLALAEEAEK